MCVYFVRIGEVRLKNVFSAGTGGKNNVDFFYLSIRTLRSSMYEKSDEAISFLSRKLYLLPTSRKLKDLLKDITSK